MKLSQILTQHIQDAIQQLFDTKIERLEFQLTRKDFEGDITMVIFPLLKIVKGNPIEIGTKIGDYLLEHTAEVVRFNVVSGFLNLVISNRYYLDFFNAIKDEPQYGFIAEDSDAKVFLSCEDGCGDPVHGLQDADLRHLPEQWRQGLL